MDERPTTINGPLHSDEVSLQAREITAYFATVAQAQAARDALTGAGVGADRVVVTEARTQAETLAPADDNIIGKIRETLMPDDGTRATRAAVQEGLVLLAVAPGESDADLIIGIIESAKPTRFDASLEKWRSATPSE